MSFKSKKPGHEETSEESQRAISWFPGHMHKAQKRLSQEIKNIDVVVELRDARLPLLSGNPNISEIIGHRKRLLLFNKASLSQPEVDKQWLEYYAGSKLKALFLDSDTRKGINLIFPLLKELLLPVEDKYKSRGIRAPHQRLMVVGMPNVGKSTFINRLVRENRMKTAPMPGVTRGISWVMLKDKYLLMDTPGIMLPRLNNQAEAEKLGWIGAIRDSIIGVENLSQSLLNHLLPQHPGKLFSHYGLSPAQNMTPHDIMLGVCEKRKLLLPGGEPDMHGAAENILEDFRKGLLGRFSLEHPPKSRGNS